MLGPMSDLLRWCKVHRPDQTHAAGSLVFIDLPLAAEVIDRAEAAGISVLRARGFRVVDEIAKPIPGQQIEPEGSALLECETPSGATCGSVRRLINGTWAGSPPPSGRHMVLIDFDEHT